MSNIHIMEKLFSFVNPEKKKREACHIAICGRSKSGKSTILKEILRRVKPYFRRIFIFCQTDKYTHEFSKEFDDVESFDLEKFKRICEKAKTYKEKNKQKNILICMDDISSRFYSDKESVTTISEYMTEARHYGVSILLSVHYLKTVLNPLIRENIHHYIINKNQTPKSIEILSEIIYYDPDDHPDKEGKPRTLQRFIKEETSIHPYCFMIISVETSTFKPIYIKK